jgi:hypothetical protein
LSEYCGKRNWYILFGTSLEIFLDFKMMMMMKDLRDFFDQLNYC